MQERKLLRQGDVLLVPVDALPAQAREVTQKGRRVVLAEGEATGHAHTVPASRARLLRWQSEPGGWGRPGSPVLTFLRVDAPVALRHQEHEAIPLAPGLYEVRRQREYRPRAASPSRGVWVRD